MLHTEKQPLSMRREYVFTELMKIVNENEVEAEVKKSCIKRFQELKNQGVIIDGESVWVDVIKQIQGKVEAKFRQSKEKKFNAYVIENFFEMTGARAIEPEEKVLLQQMLVIPAWNSFLSRNAGELLTDEQLIRLRKLQLEDKADTFSENSRAKIFLAGILPNLDELIQSEVLNLKKKMIAKRNISLNIDDQRLQDLYRAENWDEIRTLLASSGPLTTFEQLIDWLNQVRVRNSGPDNFDLQMGEALLITLLGQSELYRGKNAGDLVTKQTAKSLFEAGEWKRGKKLLENKEE